MRSKVIFYVPLSLLIIHCLTFLTIGELRLEEIVQNNFLDYRTKKIQIDENLKEEIYFSACGDEFFRDRDALTRLAYLCQNNDEIFLVDNDLKPIQVIDYNDELTELIKESIDNTGGIMFVGFRVCRINDYLFYTELLYDKVHTTNSDFHSQIHNGGYLEERVGYIWLLFDWFPLTSSLSD